VAEGEGRNGVFLASQGFEVLGVDSSEVGLAKARKLAASRNVTIQTQHADLLTYIPPENHFGSVISIYAHLPSSDRKRLHHLLEWSLKPGGIILLEGYHKTQIHRATGGPKNLDMLLTHSDIEQDFPHCEILLSREIEREVIEGAYHTGLASVVQFIARKTSSYTFPHIKKQHTHL